MLIVPSRSFPTGTEPDLHRKINCFVLTKIIFLLQMNRRLAAFRFWLIVCNQMQNQVDHTVSLITNQEVNTTFIAKIRSAFPQLNFLLRPKAL